MMEDGSDSEVAEAVEEVEGVELKQPVETQV